MEMALYVCAAAQGSGCWDDGPGFCFVGTEDGFRRAIQLCFGPGFTPEMLLYERKPMGFVYASGVIVRPPSGSLEGYCIVEGGVR